MEVRKRERTIKEEQGRLVGEHGERSKAGATSEEKEEQDQTCEVDSNFRRKAGLRPSLIFSGYAYSGDISYRTETHRESDMGSLRGGKRWSSSRRKYDEDDKLNPGAVVPRRRLKQFAINFPQAEGNGAGRGTERDVAEPGHRKDLEQGFWKESIREFVYSCRRRIERNNFVVFLGHRFSPQYSLFSLSDIVNGGKPAASRTRTIGLCATFTIYYKTVPLCSRYVHSHAHFNPPFSGSSGTPEVCTFQETTAWALPRFDTFCKLQRMPATNDIASRGKSRTAISEKTEKRISCLGRYSSWMHVECYVHSALRKAACMRSGPDMNATPIVHDASRRPARCMHASAACNARILPREVSRGMRQTIYEGRVI
ncbi:hypothetical protein ALC62_08723 [Cyphomyrmex costatus]|uniref:Uncharacterized protein n=1 Tax=Cyphomyrmex costatus TaxID=456900 RepID=A0A195CK20_9HYME|nr:hypothetical protein ALC62_08723 [Cyphomyrmex costatus]